MRNQMRLPHADACSFKDIEHDYHKTFDNDHGRIETREYWCVSDLEWLETRQRWAG